MTAMYPPGDNHHFPGCHPEDEIRTEPDDDIHTWFGLSYANYLVLSRTLMQSMPGEWQRRMVACLREIGEAFAHIPQTQAYEVIAGEEHIVREMTDEQLAAAGIAFDEGPCEEDHDHGEDEGANCWPARTYHNTRDGRELDEHERVIVAMRDPVPHYNRGRTRIPPHEVTSDG